MVILQQAHVLVVNTFKTVILNNFKQFCRLTNLTKILRLRSYVQNFGKIDQVLSSYCGYSTHMFCYPQKEIIDC